MPEVSVIGPAYNVEKYLPQSLREAVRRTAKALFVSGGIPEYEVIFDLLLEKKRRYNQGSGSGVKSGQWCV